DALAKRAESLGVGRDATERRQFVNLLSANLYIPLQKTHRKAATEIADAPMTNFSFLESHFGTWHGDEASQSAAMNDGAGQSLVQELAIRSEHLTTASAALAEAEEKLLGLAGAKAP
ncbi:MAG: hypothetical protein K1X53_08820, partial [Candidatus Sumerlaeaceae bacterium]|nr:hypothetical protein [Candidatus Sumerlaeaceae bacterium]